MDPTLYPWQQGPSLLEFLRSVPATSDLPDESVGANQIRFAAGAWDGIVGHHMRGVDEQEEARLVQRLLAALLQLVKKDSDEARVHLYDALRNESLLRHIDVFLNELTQQKGIGPDEVRPHARWLVRHSAHRNPLKFGIALLGICGDPQIDVEDLLVLARHDEFTLYAAVAIAHFVDDPIQEWWEMAQQVNGWGKVHLVERLCQYAQDREDLRNWLLRHGCSNSVMNEYLALACASSGKLAEALEQEIIDDELLDGATLILSALLSRYGPAGNIDDYADAPVVVAEMVRHLESRCTTLGRLQLVRELADWLSESDQEVWLRRSQQGWTQEQLDELASRCRSILARPGWPDRVRQGYTDSEATRHLAWGLAPSIGVDLWPMAFSRLQEYPQDAWLYSCLLESDTARVQQVIAFAEEHLPLESIGTGPADLFGFGPGFEVHSCLDIFLQRFGQGDVCSEAILVAALRSPVVRNRNLAATVVEVQPAEMWGSAVREALRRNALEECESSLKERWTELLTKLNVPRC